MNKKLSPPAKQIMLAGIKAYNKPFAWFALSNGSLALAVQDESGYFEVPDYYYSGSYDEAVATANELNDEEGISKEDAIRIVGSSM